MTNEQSITSEICSLRHEIIETKIHAVEERVDGIQACLQEVRDLQTKILYAIIGLFGTSIMILIGVIAGRAIDFGALIP